MTFETWHRAMSLWGRAPNRNLALFESIASTNRVGLELLGHRGVPQSGTWIVAFEQGRGEGRRGRHWVSPRGAGVYASYVLALPRSAVELLPLALGVALCEGLDTLGFECRLKWPNDLLLGGSKLGGILVQARGQGATVGIVAGFGVNLSHSGADLPRSDTTSLRLCGAAPSLDLARLTCVLAEQVERELAGWVDGGGVRPSAIVARYRERSAHAPGDSLTVTDGDRQWQGRFAGFSARGHLRLETATGECLVSAGEVGG